MKIHFKWYSNPLSIINGLNSLLTGLLLSLEWNKHINNNYIIHHDEWIVNHCYWMLLMGLMVYCLMGGLLNYLNHWLWGSWVRINRINVGDIGWINYWISKPIIVSRVYLSNLEVCVLLRNRSIIWILKSSINTLLKLSVPNLWHTHRLTTSLTDPGPTLVWSGNHDL